MCLLFGSFDLEVCRVSIHDLVSCCASHVSVVSRSSLLVSSGLSCW